MKRYQPALLGGLFIGVLSALPVINLGNMCCCLWVICGGVLSTYLLQQNSPTPIATSEAVVQGLLAGAIGGLLLAVAQAVLAQVLGPLALEQVREEMSNNPDIPPQFRDTLLRFLTSGNILLLTFLVTVPMYAVFAMLGSLIGVAIFRKKTPPQPQV